MQSEEVKKLFAEVTKINKRLDDLDLENMKLVMQKVAAYANAFESTVKNHGTQLGRAMRVLDRIEQRCPLMKAPTAEFESVCERLRLCDEEG